MKGTLLQLVSKGAEDIHLIKDSEMSFFKNVYKRYTNFAMESIENHLIFTPKCSGGV